MAYSDRELIARLIQCEAGGEGDNRNESSCNSMLMTNLKNSDTNTLRKIIHINLLWKDIFYGIVVIEDILIRENYIALYRKIYRRPTMKSQ